jgi:OOP family OmpA-OmpF porin
MASMIAELQKLVSPELLSAVTRQTHESDVAVAKGYDAAIPACGATIANRSDDRGFMSQLVNLATGMPADSDPTASAMRLASSPAGDTSTAAAGWLSSLFGPNLSGVTNSLARYAGIRESSASSLLMTCAPLVLGYFGRLIRRHNLNASDLAERLRSERPQFESALPAGFEMPGIARAPRETVRAAMDDAIRQRQRRETWTFPTAAVLTALGIAGLLWWGTQATRPREVSRAKVETTVPNTVGTRGTVTPAPSPALPEPPRFTFPAGSNEDRLARYLASSGSGSMSIDLDRVGFESGSSSLTPKSREQIDNIASVMRAYPKSTIVVEGHTDNVGRESANLALSRARAEAVAKTLTAAGIAADRVRAEGFGSQKPVADNSTAAGRAQNRRVTADVTR